MREVETNEVKVGAAFTDLHPYRQGRAVQVTAIVGDHALVTAYHRNQLGGWDEVPGEHRRNVHIHLDRLKSPYRFRPLPEGFVLPTPTAIPTAADAKVS